MTASALQLAMVATSVEKTKDLSVLPKMRMPLHSLMHSGTSSMWLRYFPLKLGMGVGVKSLIKAPSLPQVIDDR